MRIDHGLADTAKKRHYNMLNRLDRKVGFFSRAVYMKTMMMLSRQNT
jgi:hypothetical protein